MGEFRMPSLGSDMIEGTLRKWKVKKGDVVNRGDIIAEVETQKGIIDIEVFESGLIGELLIQEDEKVPVGTLLTHLLPLPSAATPIPIPIEPILVQKENGIVRASPLARKMATENHLVLENIIGTGPEGAVTKADVQVALKKTKEPESQISPTPSTTSDIRDAIAKAMQKSQQEIPAYTLRTVLDLKPCLEDLALRNKEKDPKERLLLVAPFMKATGLALKDFPNLNGWWIDSFQPSTEIILGMVISLRSGGILVPTIKNPGALSLEEIMVQVSERIIHARSGHLKSSEVFNPSITMTNLGEAGVESITGIIYPPQVALIATGGLVERPWAEHGMLTVRPTIEFTLSADHRATDGTYGSQFLHRIKEILANPKQL